MRSEPAALETALLRSVSRSFYLSIRFLPTALREPIGLAYLLARATDTIADTHEIDASLRRMHLATLANLVQGAGGAQEVDSLVSSFAPLQRNASERTLIKSLPGILQQLRATAAEDRADVCAVLAKISAGQSLDVERFADTNTISSLRTAAELDDYTYLVAGCVGEFWTKLCFRHLRDFARRPEAEMVELGVGYGKGLQLINILRDLGGDLRGGRCYLPADELHSLGISPATLRERYAEAEPVVQRWRERAVGGVASGVEYAAAIDPWRVRFATVLPALIGARTLALLRSARSAAVESPVKVSRPEVRSILLRTLVNLASPRSIRKQFAQLSRDDPHRK